MPQQHASIGAYIATFPTDVQALLEQLRQTIRTAAPEAIAADWRPLPEPLAPIVYFNRLPWALVLNAITDT